MVNRKNWMARKSSLLGRQQRADARIIAHNLTMQRDRTINPAGFHMPQPGPMTEGTPARKRFKDVAEAKAYLADVEKGRAPMGLKAVAAQDFINKQEGKSGNQA